MLTEGPRVQEARGLERVTLSQGLEEGTERLERQRQALEPVLGDQDPAGGHLLSPM